MTLSTPNGFVNSDWVTDGVLRQTITAPTPDSRLQTWLNNTEKDLICVARDHGVDDETFKDNYDANGMDYKIQEYATAYLNFLIAQDLWGVTNNDPTSEEKYKQKMDHYQDSYRSLKVGLTNEMFSWDHDNLTGNETAGEIILVRG